MRFNIVILTLLAATGLTGQTALQMDELFDHVGDSTALELSFGQWEQKTLSNATLASWYGSELVQSNDAVFVFNETTQDLVNLRFHRRKWQLGIATSNYSYNDRTLDASLFNALYANQNQGSGTYTYSSFSTLKHSISVGRSFGDLFELTFLLNGHQLNSLAALEFAGTITQTQNELNADFAGNYQSFNTNFTDSSRGIATLPQNIYAADSGHYSIYRYAPLNRSFGFHTSVNFSKNIGLTMFGNHLGSSASLTTMKEDNSYKLSLNTALIETIDLLNGTTSPLITPNGNYIYQEQRSEKRDTTLTRAFQPPVLGAKLRVTLSKKIDISVASSRIFYPSFENNRHTILLTKHFENNYLLAGVMIEDLSSLKSYYNLVLGARYEVAPRLSVRWYSNTATNFNYLNQKLAPKGIARMQFNLGAEITLP